MTEEKALRAADELRQRFNAHVDIDEVRPGRFRFNVLSKHYGAVSPLTRQDQAWEVLDRVLTPDEKIDISMVLMMGPEDVGQELVELMP